jgi:Uma2 family endonuclease
MNAERIETQWMSVEDYLAWEETQPERHEYVGGMVYAMAGGTQEHSAIASNSLVSLGSQLRGKPCRPHGSDLKIRVSYPTHTRFYYPDVTVVCTPAPAKSVFHDAPVVIVEVVSESTRRTDETEKRDAYFTLASLRLFILFSQEKAEAVVWRRIEQGFAREVHAGLDAVIALPEIEARLPLADVYEAVALGG